MQQIIDFLKDESVWAWMAVGVLLIIAEVFIPGTFVMWFGFGAILTGIFVGIIDGIPVASQLLIFIIMSVISLSVGYMVYGKFFGLNEEKNKNLKTGAQRFIGKTFIVSETIRNGKGKVAVGDTVWLARSQQKIEKGSEVTVIGVDGTQLLVELKK